MWTTFDRTELARLRDVLREAGHEDLARKAAESIDLHSSEDAAAFVEAAAEQSHDVVYFDDEVALERSDDGAFVLCWLWVSNDEAGLPDPDDQEDHDHGDH